MSSTLEEYILFTHTDNHHSALMLWENEISPTLALEAAKLFALPLEYLMQLWPSECKFSYQLRSMASRSTYQQLVKQASAISGKVCDMY